MECPKELCCEGAESSSSSSSNSSRHVWCIHTHTHTHTHTHIYVTQQVVEATVAVVGGAAQGLENAQPLGTERTTVRRQLRTQDPDVVHPGGTRVSRRLEW